MRRYIRIIMLTVPLVFLLCIVAYNIPFVHDRLSWRLDEVRTNIKNWLNPPEEAVFIPKESLAPAVEATLLAMTPTHTPTPTSTIAPEATQSAKDTPTPAPTATPTATLLPETVRLEGVKYEDQHNRWNYCGPANLSMSLTFWGWDGNRDVVGEYVKPNQEDDKNVMPYEMVDFIQTQTTGLDALVRYGGDLNLIKRLVAAGFPVLTEKGYYEYDYTGKWGWFGHYQYITGYDDVNGVLIVQDTYIKNGENHEFPYADFLAGWRSFNYVFLVTFPTERSAEVMELLGDWGDQTWANQRALSLAKQEAEMLTGTAQFFAWFNVGTGYVNTQSYADAAAAYDYAFNLYAELPASGDEPRPYRMMWYQTGPYFAYYYSGRYQDVIDLATQTLYQTVSKPVLEESLYWRGMALYTIGDTDGAIADYRASLQAHPGFSPSLYQLQLLGVSP